MFIKLQLKLFNGIMRMIFTFDPELRICTREINKAINSDPINPYRVRYFARKIQDRLEKGYGIVITKMPDRVCEIISRLS